MEHAIEFLTAVGQITDAKRQEFVLLSDVLGASMDPNPIRHCPGTRGRLTPGKRPASGAGREHDQLLPSPIEKMVLD